VAETARDARDTKQGISGAALKKKMCICSFEAGSARAVHRLMGIAPLASGRRQKERVGRR
jgi:hypothetical protein